MKLLIRIPLVAYKMIDILKLHHHPYHKLKGCVQYQFLDAIFEDKNMYFYMQSE